MNGNETTPSPFGDENLNTNSNYSRDFVSVENRRNAANVLQQIEKDMDYDGRGRVAEPLKNSPYSQRLAQQYSTLVYSSENPEFGIFLFYLF